MYKIDTFYSLPIFFKEMCYSISKLEHTGISCMYESILIQFMSCEKIMLA